MGESFIGGSNQLYRLTAFILLFITVLGITGITSSIIHQPVNPVIHESPGVIHVSDPIGDDDGGGTITYPSNDVFQPGVFDLTGLDVGYNGSTIVFTLYLRNLGGNPWNGSNGFSLQYIQVYIRDPGWTGDYNTSSFGLQVDVSPGWSYALLVNGGWGYDPLPRGEEPAMYDAAGNLLAVNGDGLLVEANQSSDAVSIIVDRNRIPANSDPQSWGLLVAVAGYDGYAPYRVREVTIDGGEWVFGGGAQCAVDNGLEPYIIDLLSDNPIDQYAELNSYYCRDNRRATVTPLHFTPMSTLYSFNDPLGDDDGPGNYTYPLNNVFQPGVFDLRGFTIYRMNDYFYMNITLNNLGDNPWNAPNGFCLQYIQVYILPAGENEASNYSYGLNTMIYPGWKYLVLVGPGYNPPALPNGQYSGVYVYRDNEYSVAADQSDPSMIYSYADQAHNSIIVRLGQGLIPGLDNPGTAILVAVAGYDGYEPDKVRKINTTATEWLFGGASSSALRAGVEPRIIDALYPDAETQYNFLGSYDPMAPRQAVVGMMFLNGSIAHPPAKPAQPPQTTTTTTTTSTTTTTTMATTTTTSVTATTTPSTTTTPSITTTTPPPTTTTTPTSSTTPTTSSRGSISTTTPAGGGAGGSKPTGPGGAGASPITTAGGGGVSPILVVSIAVSAVLVILALVIIRMRSASME